MAEEDDQDRVRRKAHQLWEADGRPHGRDADHWVQAREIIAIEDSQGDTLLPRDFGAEEPIEHADEALRNLGDFPNLTDQGENLLTSTDREPYAVPSVEVPTSGQPGIAPPTAKADIGTTSASSGTKPPASAGSKPKAAPVSPGAPATGASAKKPPPSGKKK